MKVREELETLVGDGEVLLRVLEELGLHVWFRYEKYREEFCARGRDRRDRRNAGRRVRRDRRQRDGHRRDGRGARPHAGRLHPRLVPRRCSCSTATSCGLTGPDMVFDSAHARPLTPAPPRAGAHRRARHAAAAADLRPRQGRRAGQRRTAGPPRPRAGSPRTASATSSSTCTTTRRRSPRCVGDGARPRRARPLFLGAAGARLGRRSAARAAAARSTASDRDRFLHRQRRHADRRRHRRAARRARRVGRRGDDGADPEPAAGQVRRRRWSTATGG